MSFASDWPSITDSADGRTGTVISKINIWDKIKTAISNLCISAGIGSVLTPATACDEIVAARGSMGSLDARLDVALNEDGTPRPVAGQATETEVGRAQAERNIVKNGDLERWPAGGSAAPEGWVLSGAGATVVRAGPAQSDTTDLGVGTYCAKITSGAGAVAKLTNTVISSSDMSRWRNVKGRKVSVVIRGKAGLNNILRFAVDDGVVVTPSAYIAGDSVEHNMTLLVTLSASATKLDVYAEVALGTVNAYVGGLSVVFSDVLSDVWPVASEVTPRTALVGGNQITTRIPGNLTSQVNAAQSSGTGETDAHTFSLKGGTMDRDGDRLHIQANGGFTSNGNTKTFKLYFGGTSITLASVTGAFTGWCLEAWVVRESATAQKLYGVLSFDNFSASFGAVVRASPTETLANDITVKTTLQMAVSGTITETEFSIDYWPVAG
jgi:hypothetical protein